jgi:GNAT superfamily N-acetyltransferase
MEWTRGDCRLSDDKSQLDEGWVHAELSKTYWAANRPRSMIEKAIRNSLCLGLYRNGQQIGFCRAVTDYATFAWISDVIVREDCRGKGLGHWMVKTLVELPELQTANQALRTLDAHGLYEKFGFKREEFMRRVLPIPS